MGEKQRGKDWLEQRSRHGGRRRGVFPTPAFTSFSQERAQSRQDKALLLQKIAELQAHVERDNGTDIGNKDLPAYQKKQEIIANIEAYKAIGLDGPTGSGKSTQLPQYLYEAGYDKTFVLVPRRIIADNLCDRIREEMQSHVGEQDVNEIVGIAHGERSEQHENNKIVIMTPNTYVRMAHDISSEFAEKKVAIISDEIHEANIYTEVATGVAAMSVKENDNWRLIAASATHNTGSLRHSLETLNDGYAPIVSIEGRPFDLDIREEPLATPMEVYRRIGSDHERTMIFTSGKAEIDYIIEKIKEELDGHIPGSSNQVEFRKLHGELREVELLHVADPVSDNRRLVIVSSPAGMSGITIPGVTLVITDGTINRSELDSDGVSGLERHFLSKGEIMQQFGRAGRDVPGGVGILAKPITVYEDLLEKRGVCVDEPAMPFRPFQLREEHAPPEIRNTNLSGVVLGVAVNDYSFADINSYIPHPVESSKIISAQEALYHLGAFDDDHRATESGRLMHRYPVSPELSRGIVEATSHHPAPQHLLRVALIASAIEVGGLQDFSRNKSRSWRQLVRPTTTDDFIAQLDISLALDDAYRRDGEHGVRSVADEHGLHYKKIEQAQKVSRKILNSLGLRRGNIIPVVPTENEEIAVREDFTAGMIDYIYEPTGREHRVPVYQNILRDAEATKRKVSTRSVYEPRSGELIAGFPRWFNKEIKSGEMIRHNVLEMVLKVNPAVVGFHADQRGLLNGRLLSPRMEGDQVVEREQPMFGTIPVGAERTTTTRGELPEASRRLLTQRALENPGKAQLALRDIAVEIEHYENTIPQDELLSYQNERSIPQISHSYIESLIYGFAGRLRTLNEIDRALGEEIYSKDISINTFYDEAARIELQSRSPKTLTIAGDDVPLRYDKGQPYITGLSKAQRKAVDGPLFLEDGREVLVQVSGGPEGVVRLSGAALKLDISSDAR